VKYFDWSRGVDVFNEYGLAVASHYDPATNPCQVDSIFYNATELLQEISTSTRPYRKGVASDNSHPHLKIKNLVEMVEISNECR
jgi:hypothetical protein